MSTQAPISYDAMCKVILTKKTYRMHLLLAVFAVGTSVGITMFLTVLQLRPSIWPAFSFWVWTYGVVVYASVVAPLLVGRKVWLTTRRDPPRTLKAILSSPADRWQLFTYTISAIVFACTYVRLMRLPRLGNDVDAKLILYSRQTGAAIINARPILFVGTLVLFSLVYGTMQLVTCRTSVAWPTAEEQSITIPAAIARHLTRNAAAAVKTSVATITISALLYQFVLREPSASLTHLLIPLPILARSADYATRHWVLTVPVLIKLNSAGIALALLWEVSNAFFDAYTSRTIRPPRMSVLPNKVLFNGLRSRSDYFQQQAWLEFATLMRTSETAKKALFEDMSPEYALAIGDRVVSPKSGLWGAVAREGLLLLGQDYGLLKRRGKSAPAASAGAPPPKAIHQASNFKPLPSAQALKPLPETSTAEALFKSVTSTPVPVVSQATNMLMKRGQEIQTVRKMEADFAQATKQVEGVVAGAKAVIGVGPQVSVVPGLDEILPRRELDTWIIDSLSYLIASSPQLDKYGLSTRTAPSILEALTLYETQLQELLQELHQRVSQEEARSAELAQQKLATLGVPGAGVRWLWTFLGWKGVGREREGLEAVVESLNVTGEAIRRILRTYGEDISSFRFPPHVARKLRTYVPGAI